MEIQIAEVTIATYATFMDYYDGNSSPKNSGTFHLFTEHYQWTPPGPALGSGVKFRACLVIKDAHRN